MNDSIMVKGKVLNSSGIPIQNVSVAVDGSSDLPYLTNDSGEFFVWAGSGNDWLTITPSAGYKSKQVYLNNRDVIVIYLTEDDLSSGFDEINVLSKFKKKRNITASFSELNIDVLPKVPVLTADQYMQGRIPGMHVVNRSGDPGSGAISLIRGINSINTSNQPLYIIDGVPLVTADVMKSEIEGFSYNPLLSLNMQDISSIYVIKDPVYTAAYGSKASNGLVIVETLAPSSTQTIIEVDLRSGYSLAPANQIPQLNAQQHKTLISEVLFSSGRQEEYIRENFPNLYLTPEDDRYIDYRHNTNWQDIIFRNSFFTNTNVNIKGGDEIARYGLSFGYINADGIIKSTNYQGYNLKFVSLLNIFQWLEMNADVNLNYNNSTFKESAKIAQTSPILTSLTKSPMLNPFRYDEDGQELITLSAVDELGVSNPKSIIDNFDAKNNNLHFASTLGVTAKPMDNLVFKSTFSLSYNLLREFIFMPNTGMELYYNNEAINISKGINNSLSAFYNNTYAKYDKSIGKKHKFSFTIGSNLLSNKYEFDKGLTRNAHENDQYRMLQDGTNSLREIEGSNRNWNWVSFYESANYSFMDKYMLSITASLDGSSRLGKEAANTVKLGGVPFGFFYAGGFGWRLSNERYLKNIAWLEELKLRLSYGKAGNDNIGESNASNYYATQNYRETSGLYPAIIPNEELTYEAVNQLNIGLDLALLGYRFNMSIDAYQKQVKNMFIYSPVEAYLGYKFRPENSGEMVNTGMDFSLFWRIIDKPVFKWDFQATLSHFSNEIIKIEGTKLVTSVTGAEIVNMEGEVANSFYGYVFKGVYATTEEAETKGLLNNKLRPYSGGDAIYEDLSGPDGEPDGIINNYDKTVIGSFLPDNFGGLSNTFTYKRWALNLFFQFVSGNEVFNFVRYQNEKMTGLQNQSRNVLNRWQYEGHVTDVPRALWNDPVGNSAFSTRWIERGDYFRLKNVLLSYSLPENFLGFRSVRFYVSVRNLLTFTEYLGYDPEFGYSYSPFEQGIDYGLTPQSREFLVGIRLGL
jgi:TonB-linked SusC/RagA family outer membrane protein